MAHRVYFPELEEHGGGVITIGGEEAHHALRVKRLVVGDAVEVGDGRGRVAHTRLAGSDKGRDGWVMRLEIARVEEERAVVPRVVVVGATPKGERLEGMIEGLSQVGTAAWRPLLSKRTVVDPREGKLARLERVALEAMKQCGRAWVLEVMTPVKFRDVLVGGGRLVIADASGGEYVPDGGDEVSLLVGPEGGWAEEELGAARAAGAMVVSFGPHVMRVEVAAVAGAAQVLGAERVFRGRAV